MCFPPLDEIKDGMRLPTDYATRVGYRLPTIDEWWCACLAFSASGRPFGDSLELAPKYAAYGREEPLLPGALKPNLSPQRYRSR